MQYIGAVGKWALCKTATELLSNMKNLPDLTSKDNNFTAHATRLKRI
jgi:hypothetical protein